jgi:subtilisin family serine protease
MDLDYFILRVEKTKIPTRAQRGPNLEGARHGRVLGEAADEIAPLPPADKVTIETARLTPSQTGDILADPANKIVTPSIPVCLVEPLSTDDPSLAKLPLQHDPMAEAMADKVTWGITAIGADQSPYTGQDVRVAVLDTGIRAGHPAFHGVQFIRENWTGDGSDDGHGHGTHCAGTIFGRDVMGVRIGVARGVKTALIGKVLDDSGRGSTTAVLRGLHWAWTQKANVISMSLGFDFPALQTRLVESGRPAKLATSMALKAYRENLIAFSTLIDLITQENADSVGAVVVAASGNESLRLQDQNFVIDTSLPAAATPEIISVGAAMRTDGGLVIAPFSNINPVLCAPGFAVVSANVNDGLSALNGTSMACPHVAGAATLWWEYATKQIGKATASSVRALVVGRARTSGFAETVTHFDRGAGRVTAPTSIS